MRFSKYIRLIVSILVLLIVAATPQDDFAAKKKRKTTRKARTSKVTKSRKKKRTKTTRAAAKQNLPVVVLGTTGPIDAPEPFVTLPSVKDAPRGLDGRTIAIWPSHGKYYAGDWIWQRPKLFGTVEDLLSRSFVDPYIVPMLENAGAYVMMPRERDFSTKSLLIDHDRSTGDGRFATRNGRHHWKMMGDSTGYMMRGNYIVDGENPFVAGTSGRVETVLPADSAHLSSAAWYGTVPEAGERAVYVSYQSYPNSATDATYIVNHLGGSSEVVVNQQMGGGTWIYIGTYPFDTKHSEMPLVELKNVSEDENAVVSADAVRIGGGMGIVARSKGGTPRTSGVPAYLEGARYYIQSAGFPEYVYSPNESTNDYVDDYKCRAHWVNYMTGGSALLPDTLGLGIPVDAVMAFHTDAGLTTDSTVIGTLGLYSTDDGNPLGNGTSRYANRDLANGIINQVVNDIRRQYDPNWRSRGSRDRKYYEVRDTKVPAMIMELLSHQNFEDMKRAHDPAFRFLVGRAVYKAMLRFLADRYDLPYTVQPLPIEAFEIKADGDGRYTLQWHPVADPLEPSAMPTYYIVYEAVGDKYYRPVAVTESPSWSTKINDDKIHAYYIVAGNDGGTSFPSEVLALYDRQGMPPSVEIVNGFTRISGPRWIDGPDYAGFDFTDGYGVPDSRDVHFIGAQYDFDPTGVVTRGANTTFGASFDNESTYPRYGNSFDFPLVHGEALRNAGRGFVSSSLKAFEQSSSTPKAVDLILGQQRTTRRAGSKVPHYQLFPKGLRNRLTTLRNRGTALMVSGSYLASEIFEADSLTRDTVGRFAADILGYAPLVVGPDSLPRLPRATSSLEITGAEIIPGMPRTGTTHLESFANSRHAGAGTPQAITPANDMGLVIARYSDTGYPAAIAVEGETTPTARRGRVVVASFPAEAMEEDANRQRFISETINYLIGAEAPVIRPKADKVPTSVDASKSGKNKKGKKPKAKKEDDRNHAKSKQDAARNSAAKAKHTGPVKDSKSTIPPPAPRQTPAPKAVPHPRR